MSFGLRRMEIQALLQQSPEENMLSFSSLCEFVPNAFACVHTLGLRGHTTVQALEAEAAAARDNLGDGGGVGTWSADATDTLCSPR